jgi:ribonucleoside-diphosphate reductase alpha subunit
MSTLSSSSSSAPLKKSSKPRTVIKRNGSRVPVEFDKITRRVRALSGGLEIDPSFVTQEVTRSMTDNMHVSDIDELAAQESVFMIRTHVDYATLAGRLVVSNLHKLTPSCFSEAMEIICAQSWDWRSLQESPRHASFLDAKFMAVVRKHAKVLDAAIQHQADYLYSYFGIQTLLNGYLHKLNDPMTQTEKPVERPQYMLMRNAVWLNMDDIAYALETYAALSQKRYTHASPTLFNAAKPNAQASSCFLLQIPEDSLDSIFDTLKQCAQISKHAGGIGLAVHDVRAQGALIRSSGGFGDGLVPMLRVFNNVARYVNQGGKRKGAFAIYLEPWHADILEVIALKKPRGAEESRASDLHYAMWIPDLFMKRVRDNQKWSLFSPDTAPGLAHVHGDEFDRLYCSYENNLAIRKTVINARDIWETILNSQIETGEPYVLFKDHCNHKSNQQNLGTITSSNLCAEILEYTSKDEIAVCNLASICLPSFLDQRLDSLPEFNFQRLYDTAYMATRNLDKVIDLNFYPVPEAKTSNMRHRPIGVGVQGLADVFCLLLLPFDSPLARQLNRDIFETIYFAAMTASKDLAKEKGPYETYQGSPVSQGLFQFDLWNVTPSARWNWDSLKSEVRKYGVRNSLLVAMMPTASTAQIMGNNEGCESYTTNLYVRRTDAGEFIVVNTHLANILSKNGLWTSEVIDQIIAHDGSIQYIEDIPQHIRDVFRTAYEIKTKPVIEMAADRGPYICQTQSMNLWIATPTTNILHNAHFYSWEKGLKTGIYYLRSRALTSAQKVVLDPKAVEKAKQKTQSSQPKGSPLGLPRGSPSVSHFKITDQHIDEPGELDKANELDNPNPAVYPTEQTSESDKISTHRDETPRRQRKTFQRGGRTFECFDDVCVSCGS